MIDIIPPNLLHPGRALDFAHWLRAQPLDPQDRKQLVILWCDHVGVPLSHDLVLQAGAA